MENPFSSIWMYLVEDEKRNYNELKELLRKQVKYCEANNTRNPTKIFINLL